MIWPDCRSRRLVSDSAPPSAQQRDRTIASVLCARRPQIGPRSRRIESRWPPNLVHLKNIHALINQPFLMESAAEPRTRRRLDGSGKSWKSLFAEAGSAVVLSDFSFWACEGQGLGSSGFEIRDGQSIDGVLMGSATRQLKSRCMATQRVASRAAFPTRVRHGEYGTRHPSCWSPRQAHLAAQVHLGLTETGKKHLDPRNAKPPSLPFNPNRSGMKHETAKHSTTPAQHQHPTHLIRPPS